MSHTPPGDHHPAYLDPSIAEADYEGKPTDEELKTLRRVPGNLPAVAYLICIIEFCERASYYGVSPLIGNYVNRPRMQLTHSPSPSLPCFSQIRLICCLTRLDLT